MNLQERINVFLKDNTPADVYSGQISHYYAKYLQFLGIRDTVFVDHSAHHLIDSEGNRYLDLVAGYGSCHFGRHEKVRDAVRQAVDLQVPNLVQFSIPLLATMLSSEILSYMDGRFQRLFYTNGGAEAVDYALKMSRLYSGKSNVLCFEGCYHGLTLGALSVNGVAKHQKLFNTGCEQNILPFNNAKQLEQTLKRRHREIGGIIIEPVQGRTGEVATEEFVRGARELCDRYKLALIFDEIKTGFGRTGKNFFYDWYGIHPDIVTLAKGMSGGMTSVGAVAYREAVYKKVFNNIENIAVFSSTFKENNLAMSAGLAVMDIYRENPGLNEQVQERERQLRKRLENTDDRNFSLAVNGRGLLLTIALKEVKGKRVVQSLVDLIEGDLFYDKLCYRLFADKQILISIPNRFGKSLAFIPALDIRAEDIDYFCDSLLEVLDDMLSQSNLALLKETISDARTVL